MVKYLKKEDSFVKSFHFGHCEHSTVNFIPEKLQETFCFYVRNNGNFCIDITFEICNGLDFTYTTYQNLSLLDINSKYSEFLGLSFWPFKKTRETYRRFGGEFLINEPFLINLQKIRQRSCGRDEFWLTLFYLGRGLKYSKHIT